MEGMKKTTRNRHTGCLARAAASVRQLLARAQTPADNPSTALPELPALPKEDHVVTSRRRSFSNEIFTELLTELPGHRRQILRAWEAGDLETLRAAVHKLLGAVAYCDAPELEEALRELRQALKTEDQYTVDVYHERALNVIDSTLL